MPRDGSGHDLTRRNQSLLVGERHGAPLLDGRHSWREARGADDGGKDDVGRAGRGFDEGSGSGGGGDPGARQRVAQFDEAGFVGDDRDFSGEFARERSQFAHLTIGGQRNDAPFVGLTPDEVES